VPTPLIPLHLLQVTRLKAEMETDREDLAAKIDGMQTTINRKVSIDEGGLMKLEVKFA